MVYSLPDVDALQDMILSDRDYYALRLQQLLSEQIQGVPKDVPKDADIHTMRLIREHEILLQQARHLSVNGSSDPIDYTERTQSFGDDRYIARNIALLQLTPEASPELVANYLRRISDSANLHTPGENSPVPFDPRQVIQFVFDRFAQALSYPERMLDRITSAEW